jgi:hypothetical protein
MRDHVPGQKKGQFGACHKESQAMETDAVHLKTNAPSVNDGPPER